MGQLATSKAKVATLQSEAEQARVRIGHLTKELKEKEPRARKAEGDGKGLVGELERARKDIMRLETELKGLGFDEDRERELSEAREAAARAVRTVLERRDAAKAGLSRLDFQYVDPTRGFDRSKVKGLVANLITIEEANLKAAGALEVSAGGRLYNVCYMIGSRCCASLMARNH